MTAPARVAVFTLGGTISMTPPGGGDGAVPALSATDLLSAVRGLAALEPDLSVHEVMRVPSPAVTIDDVLDLGAAVKRELAAGAGGVVVVQGTDTMEETAFLLDLVHAGEAPVVVTGAMRHPGLDGADGPANLLAAVVTASSPLLCGLGCVVVIGDEIHSARYVRKTHSTSVTAFASPATGPLGMVAEAGVMLLLRPAGRSSALLSGLEIPAAGERPAVRVGLLTLPLGDDGELLRAAAGRFDGLVVAAYGMGHVPPWLVPDLEVMAGDIPVVLASRTGAGPVLESMYGFPGSESDLRARGLIGAGMLDPLKARLLLHLLLVAGAGRERIARAFRAARGADGSS